MALERFNCRLVPELLGCGQAALPPPNSSLLLTPLDLFFRPLIGRLLLRFARRRFPN